MKFQVPRAKIKAKFNGEFSKKGLLLLEVTATVQKPHTDGLKSCTLPSSRRRPNRAARTFTPNPEGPATLFRGLPIIKTMPQNEKLEALNREQAELRKMIGEGVDFDIE
ncbi:hypothetical protein [Paramuribaculum intestinale]|uniref:hypothetical protein n=1 Tax=Paramuribaculum intestinale TaxID=2094151 RepID=UPI003F6900AC